MNWIVMGSKVFRLLLLLSVFSLQVQADNLGFTKSHPLLFGVDSDYPPLQYVDAEGIPHGNDVEFTQELMRRLNIPFTYSPNTWENIAGDVLNGRVDLGMMVFSPYRQNLTNYSQPVFRLYYQVVYRNTEKGQFNVRNLTSKSIAYMASRPITDTLTKVGAQLHVVKDLSMAMVNLSNGKYDAVICFRYQAKYLIERYKLENLETEDLALTPREYCFVSHNKELIDAINKELDAMDSEGVIRKFYSGVVSDFDSFEIPAWFWYALLALLFVILFAFIVIQHHHQKELRREMERAQESERLKTVFLGNVSHALRTPLNAIIGFSDVLSTTDVGLISPEEHAQMLKLINDNGRQLLYFINELLQLSDIESNSIQFNRSELQLAETMNEMAERVRPELKPGVTLEVEGDGGTVMADVKLMTMVTMHCLNNAVKHTSKGRIILAYRPEKNGLRIEVRDTGDGIPQTLRENLFSLLTNKHTYVQNEVPGLGLSICKAIVDRSHGRIGVEALPEGGTMLWHWVPVKVY